MKSILGMHRSDTQNIIHTIPDLDRSRLSDTRSAENDWIGADTDPNPVLCV